MSLTGWQLFALLGGAVANILGFAAIRTPVLSSVREATSSHGPHQRRHRPDLLGRDSAGRQPRLAVPHPQGLTLDGIQTRVFYRRGVRKGFVIPFMILNI